MSLDVCFEELPRAIDASCFVSRRSFFVTFLIPLMSGKAMPLWLQGEASFSAMRAYDGAILMTISGCPITVWAD